MMTSTGCNCTLTETGTLVAYDYSCLTHRRAFESMKLVCGLVAVVISSTDDVSGKDISTTTPWWDRSKDGPDSIIKDKQWEVNSEQLKRQQRRGYGKRTKR